MAERRMFAKTIIDSDAFLDMPVTARLLYYDLSMRADDDGFVNSPKKIMRMVGASQDDLSILCMRKFILLFDSGIVVIKHWRIHNYIAKDRYTETKYKDEKATLSLDENNAYTTGIGEPLGTVQKIRKPLTSAQQKRLEAKKESSLPYSFEYKIRNAFVGKTCPICGCTMSYENELVKPTIQHNKPISMGGKHEIDNISVICNSCNSSIQNRAETEPYNTELVKEIWECIGNVAGMDTQVRLGKDRLGKVSVELGGKKATAKRFAPPTVDEVKAYCLERGNGIDPEHFCDYYNANGWMAGKNHMKDWKAAVRNWERRDKKPVVEIDRNTISAAEQKRVADDMAYMRKVLNES